ncbi:MAG: BspA family leucine-rich repeat surface protein [Lachnospiraceae bacterium]|nr:BspA family leucine-rich repeat surface protein [Lachnospiraceae bacterium]
MFKLRFTRSICLFLSVILIIASLAEPAFASDVSGNSPFFEDFSYDDSDTGSVSENVTEDPSEEDFEPVDYLVDEYEEEVDGPFMPIEYDYSSACEVITDAKTAKARFDEWGISSAMKDKLYTVLAGHIGIYDKNGSEVVATLGSRAVADRDDMFYIYYYNAAGKKRSHGGWTCFIYANAIYSFLFGDIATSRYTHTPVITNVAPTYAAFKKQNIRTGDYAWYQGANYWQHAQIILRYDENTISIIEGNADGNGLIDIVTLPWSEYATFVGKYDSNKVVTYITHASDSLYNELYPQDPAKELYFSIDEDGNLKTSKNDIASDTSGTVKWVLNETGGLAIVGEGNYEKNGDLSPWNDYLKKIKGVKVIASGITDTSYMFKNFPELKKFDIEGLDMSAVKTADGMFAGCTWLEKINFGRQSIGNIESCIGMFEGCTKLSVADLSTFSFSKVTSAKCVDLLKGCDGLKCVYSPINIAEGTSIELPEKEGDPWCISSHGVVTKIPGGFVKSLRVYRESFSDPYVIKGSLSFASGTDSKTMTLPFEADFGLFEESAYEYSEELTKLSLKVSMAALCDRSKSSPETNIKNIISAMGFKGASVNYSSSNNPIGTALAYKITDRAGRKDTVILLALSDENCKQAWSSDFNIGDTKSQDHEGFLMASESALTALNTYIKNNKKNFKGEVRLWITGYGRGASVGNLLAKNLDKGAIDTLKPSNIFAFGFEGSATTLSEDVHNELYRNIVSVASADDIYAELLSHNYGFDRYGVTYYLPTRDSYEDYSNYETGLKNNLSLILGEEGSGTGLMFRQKEIVDAVCDHLLSEAVSKSDYTALTESTWRNVATNSAAKKASNDRSFLYEDLLKGFLTSTPSGNFTGDKEVLFIDFTAELETIFAQKGEAGSIYKALAKAHAPELCLAHMETLNEPVIKTLTEAPAIPKMSTVNITTMGNGIVSGKTIFTPGSSITLRAYSASEDWFLGWFEVKGEETVFISADPVFVPDVSKAKAGEVCGSYYAFFTDNENVMEEPPAAVLFDKDGNPLKILSPGENGKIALTENLTTESGESFGGWYYEDGSKAPAVIETVNTVFLYPFITKDSCRITFKTDDFALYNDVSPNVLPCDDILVAGGEKAELPTPSIEGLVFCGWFTDTDGKGTEYTGGTVVVTDVTLYPYWMYDGFTIRPIPDQTYTGKEIKPALEVYDGTKLLTQGKDYTVSYSNNKKAANADAAKAPTVAVKGKGNYSGSTTIHFNILKKNLADADITVSDMLLSVNNKKALPVDPKPVYNKKSLSLNKDYTYEIYPLKEGIKQETIDEVTLEGEYAIVIKGMGNFTGEREVNVTVKDSKLMSKAKISAISDQSYTGWEITPKITVKYGNKKIPATAYTVSYVNNIKAGTATVTVTGIEAEGYTGIKTATFKIKAASIKNATVKNPDGTKFKTAYSYSDAYIRPGVSVTTGTGSSRKTLVRGVDYIVSYKNNKNPGTGSVIITGINSYSGTLKKNFTISAYDIKSDREGLITVNDVSAGGDGTVSFSESEIPEVVYTKGGATINDLVVRYKGRELVCGIDYTLKYKYNNRVRFYNEKNPPALYIQGKGIFTGKLTIPFTIEMQHIYSDEITMTAADVAFSKKPGKYKSAPVLRDSNGKALVEGTDYMIVDYSYADDTDVSSGNSSYHRNAGETVEKKDIIPVGTRIKILVSGMGNYGLGDEHGICERSVIYTVRAASIKNATVKLSKKEYTGRAIEPGAEDIKVTVSGSAKPLVLGVDYVIESCSNNVNAGKNAKVTIKGIGNYTGTVTKKFTIKARAFELLKTLMKGFDRVSNKVYE